MTTRQRESIPQLHRDLIVIEASLRGEEKSAALDAAQAVFDRADIDFCAAEKALLGALLRAILARQDRLTSIVKVGTHFCIVLEEDDAAVRQMEVDLHLAVVGESELIDLSSPTSKEADA
jgi:hypothetical protein